MAASVGLLGSSENGHIIEDMDRASSSGRSLNMSSSTSRSNAASGIANLASSIPRWKKQSASSSSIFPNARPQRILLFVGLAACLAPFLWYSRRAVKQAWEKPQVYDIELHATVKAYHAPEDPQRVFDWSSDNLLPQPDAHLRYSNGLITNTRSSAGSASSPHVVPVDIYPPKISMDGAIDLVKPEEVVMSFTTPYSRAREMCKYWKHFLSTGAQCLVVLPREEYMFIKDLQYYLEKEGLQHCHVISPNLGDNRGRYEHRVLDAPRRMTLEQYHDRSGKEIKPKWYIVIDDDTQFLDFDLLLRELSSRRHTERHMLCALTESRSQIGRHGRICYGGGGIVLSSMFAHRMADRMEECFWHHAWRFGGDEMLTHCASTATANETGSIPPDQVFEQLEGLHQIDIPGDGTGMLQSGLPFITLHHWLGWLDLLPNFIRNRREAVILLLQQSAALLGGDNLFRRYVFDDGSALLTLGYSVTVFSSPLKRYEMQLVERTHRHWEHELRYNSRPAILEGKQPRGERYKTTYYIDKVDLEDQVMIYRNQRGDIVRIRMVTK